MLINFFFMLRTYGVPTTLRELLDLLRALEQGVVFADMDGFYRLARLSLVKDERWYDRFDRAFGHYFHDIQSQTISSVISPEWLRANLLRDLSDEERASLNKYKDLNELLQEFAKRLAEQEKRHEGGNRWVGTGGTSAFGNSGYHPEGIRVGGKSEHRRAVKVWDQRQYRGLDGDTRLGIRTTQMALRRLRRFARRGAEEELDMNNTIRATARDGGLLNVRMQAPRRNAVKVLLFLDVGGSMDFHIKACEQLFSAARLEFKQLTHFYFHNFIYDGVWQDENMSYQQMTPVEEITRKYGRDYKLIFVGDAAMSPYEIYETGVPQNPTGDARSDDSLSFLRAHYRRSAWLNPLPRDHWDGTASVGIIRQLMEDKMYPVSLSGIEECISELSS